MRARRFVHKLSAESFFYQGSGDGWSSCFAHFRARYPMWPGMTRDSFAVYELDPPCVHNTPAGVGCEKCFIEGIQSVNRLERPHIKPDITWLFGTAYHEDGTVIEYIRNPATDKLEAVKEKPNMYEIPASAVRRAALITALLALGFFGAAVLLELGP